VMSKAIAIALLSMIIILTIRRQDTPPVASEPLISNCAMFMADHPDYVVIDKNFNACQCSACHVNGFQNNVKPNKFWKWKDK
jgi:hypothetical protein